MVTSEALGRDTVCGTKLVICQFWKCLVIKENMAKHNCCMKLMALILHKAQTELDSLCYNFEML